MSDFKNKLNLYIGSFLSQIATLLVLIFIVRKASVQSIANLALIDGIILCLPFILTLVSERSAIIAYYEKNPRVGLRLFASGTILSLFLSALVILPLPIIVDKEYLILAIAVVLACTGNALYNIQIQRHIISENYSGLAVLQIKRGVGILGLAFLLSLKKDIDPAIIYPLAILGGSFMAVINSLRETFLLWKPKLFITHVHYFVKMGTIAIIVLILGYVLSNIGRYALNWNHKTQDLAVLLIYLKNTLLVTVVLTPFTTYLKPRILKAYKQSREELPVIWIQMITFSLLVTIGAITSFGILWSFWGMEGITPDYLTFAICVSGAISMWLMSSLVDLFYDHSHYLPKKMIIYTVPIAFLTASLLVLGSEIDVRLVVTAVSLSQFGILSLALFTAFDRSRILPTYSILCALLLIPPIYSILMSYLANAYSNSLIFLISSIIFTLICAALSLVCLFRYSH